MNKANEYIRTAALVVMALAMVFSSFALSNLGAEEQVMGTSHMTSDVQMLGNLAVGNGSPTVTQDGEDLYVEGQAEFDGELQVDGTLDLNGALQLDSTLTVGVDGTSYDVLFYSDTTGDYLLWDQSEEALIITGTAAATALDVRDGNVSITDDLAVDGTSNLDAIDIQGAATFGTDGTAFDVSFYSDTEGDYMMWDQSEEALLIVGTNGQDALDINDGNVDIADDIDVDGTANLDDVDIDLSASLNIDGHMVDIGSGTYTQADADNELGVAGVIEAEGMIYADAGATVLVGLTTGASGAGVDVTFYSATADDLFLWDASEESLTITGTNAQDALNITDGNVDIEDDVDINGTTNLDDVDIDLSASLNIDGHMLDVGSGTYANAAGDNDLGVAGILEVDGNVFADAGVTVAGALAANGGITVDGTAFVVTDVSGNVSTAGTLDVTGTADITGTVTANGDLTVDDTFNVDDTAFALTGEQVLTPTASMYMITSGAAVTITLADGTAGDFLYIYDSVNFAVIVADSNIRTSDGGAITLGQYDFLVLWFDGTEWIEVSLSANS